MIPAATGRAKGRARAPASLRLVGGRSRAGLGPQALDGGGAGAVAEAPTLQVGAEPLAEGGMVEAAQAAQARQAGAVGGVGFLIGGGEGGVDGIPGHALGAQL